MKSNKILLCILTTLSIIASCSELRQHISAAPVLQPQEINESATIPLIICGCAASFLLYNFVSGAKKPKHKGLFIKKQNHPTNNTKKHPIIHPSQKQRVRCLKSISADIDRLIAEHLKSSKELEAELLKDEAEIHELIEFTRQDRLVNSCYYNYYRYHNHKPVTLRASSIHAPFVMRKHLKALFEADWQATILSRNNFFFP